MFDLWGGVVWILDVDDGALVTWIGNLDRLVSTAWPRDALGISSCQTPFYKTRMTSASLTRPRL